jgi:hypothetical protein
MKQTTDFTDNTDILRSCHRDASTVLSLSVKSASSVVVYFGRLNCYLRINSAFESVRKSGREVDRKIRDKKIADDSGSAASRIPRK